MSSPFCNLMLVTLPFHMHTPTHVPASLMPHRDRNLGVKNSRKGMSSFVSRDMFMPWWSILTKLRGKFIAHVSLLGILLKPKLWCPWRCISWFSFSLDSDVVLMVIFSVYLCRIIHQTEVWYLEPLELCIIASCTWCPIFLNIFRFFAFSWGGI